MRSVPQICLDFLIRAEAVRLVAYQDSKGVWTIGVGHTGPEVVRGLAVTQSQVSAYLADDAQIAATRLAGVATAAAIARLTDHEYSALVSFVFNLGAQRSWTIWKVLNAGALDQVPLQMARFDKVRRPDGRLEILPGLEHRRAAEISLWKTADVAAAVAVVQAAPIAPPPSSETRAADTPPTPMGKPLGQSKSWFASIATAGVAVAAPLVDQAKGMIKTVGDTLDPYAADSDLVAHIKGDLTVTLAALAVTALALTYLKNRQSKT